MEFHGYPLMWKAYVAIMGLDALPPKEARDAIVNSLGHERKYWNTINQIDGEINWVAHKRPYYDLYAGIAQAFTRVNLDKVKCEHLQLPLPELLIRLPIGHEVAGKERKIRSILAMQAVSTEHKCPGWLLSIHDGSSEVINGTTVPVHSVSAVSLIPGTSIADRLSFGRANPYCDDVLDEQEVNAAFRIVAAICLLKDDTFLIEQQPLSADIDKWEKNHDLSLIEKAERRGKRGWAIGRQIELVPTFRTPHFAIRWCGKGGTDPRLRPIRGCIVLRDKVKEMPSGYQSDMSFD